MKKIFGFSLVEIVVALIIISVITAALAPIITKKMKSNSINITGGSGSSDITTECSDNPNFGSECKLCTSSYCIQCDLENCISGTYVENKSCSCKACTDIFPNCIECDSKKCTKCKDSNYYIKDGECANCPSDKICDGVNAYDKSYCDNPPAGYYCDGTNIKRCVDKYGATCASCNKTSCTACSAGYFLSGSACKPCNISACYTCESTSKCLLCNADHYVDTSYKCSPCSIIPQCFYCSSATKCNKCIGGYYVNSSNTCSPCSSIPNCADCSNGSVCTICNNGYYVNSSNTCSACTVANCARCNSDGTCLACNQKYHLSEDKKSCEADDGVFRCSDANFMRIGNLCVTRRNMGDSTTLTIPSSVTVVNAQSEYCYSYNTKCCWKGATGNGCPLTNGDYSGCDRTVCDYSAAKEICAKFNYAGKTWRLPYQSEMANWANLTSGLGSNGLMLSNGGTSNNFETSASLPNCLGGSNGANNCVAYWLYAYEESGDNALIYQLETGTWAGSLVNKSTALSIRCVTEMDDE